MQVIGEACANLSHEFRQQHSGIPWGHIIAMRNILVHQYFGIDWQEVWDTVLTDLPQLEAEIRSIIRGVQDEPEQ